MSTLHLPNKSWRACRFCTFIFLFECLSVCDLAVHPRPLQIQHFFFFLFRFHHTRGPNSSGPPLFSLSAAHLVSALFNERRSPSPLEAPLLSERAVERLLILFLWRGGNFTGHEWRPENSHWTPGLRWRPRLGHVWNQARIGSANCRRERECESVELWDCS